MRHWSNFFPAILSIQNQLSLKPLPSRCPTERLRKFHKREKEVKKKCRIRCSGERITRMERSLRLRKPNERQGTCRPKERQISI